MTILDVLRYDPLYSWSLSPLRAKKMQDTQEAGSMNVNGKRINEPSEADRALTIVAKKLGKTLSVSATINELIQQATDERNLSPKAASMVVPLHLLILGDLIKCAGDLE
ncbi:Serine/threonine-protein kinase tel1 [Ascosphaera aggregata]|nr:Serine/threonine-protein kinase tel1 [Ascosphaera aggregata]